MFNSLRGVFPAGAAATRVGQSAVIQGALVGAAAPRATVFSSQALAVSAALAARQMSNSSTNTRLIDILRENKPYQALWLGDDNIRVIFIDFTLNTTTNELTKAMNEAALTKEPVEESLAIEIGEILENLTLHKRAWHVFDWAQRAAEDELLCVYDANPRKGFISFSINGDRREDSIQRVVPLDVLKKAVRLLCDSYEAGSQEAAKVIKHALEQHRGGSNV